MATPNEEWRNYIADDPYLVPATPPVGNPVARAEIPVVILDEEDDPEEEPEEYVPYGHEGEYESDSGTGTDEIPQDAQDPAEDLTDDRITQPPPPPRPMRCCPEGNCPLTRRTARMSVPRAAQRDELGFAPFPFRGPQPYRRFEVGGPSQAPPPAVAPSLPPASTVPPPAVAPSPPPATTVPPPRDAPTMAQHMQVVNQVHQLRDMRTEDSNAMQTLYCRVGDDHSHANTMGAHIRAVEYRLEITEQELQAAQRELLQLRGQLAELTRFVRRRLG